MNGRCENDPFDQARNVCGLCYGEFCPTCLVDVKGRKHPLCRECAIAASGVRAGAKPVNRGPKRTAAARRKALQEAPAQENFQYFSTSADEDLAAAEAEFMQDEEPAGKRKRRNKKASKAEAAETSTAKKPASKSKKKAADEELVDDETATTATSKPKAASKSAKTDAKTKTDAPKGGTRRSSAGGRRANAADAPAKRRTASKSDSATKRRDKRQKAKRQAADAGLEEASLVDLDERLGGGGRDTAASAVDQLDSIREQSTGAEESESRSEFRKPRPFIQPKTDAEVPPALAGTDSADQGQPDRRQPNRRQPRPTAAPAADTPSDQSRIVSSPTQSGPISSELVSPFSQAPPPELPRRRGESDAEPVPTAATSHAAASPAASPDDRPSADTPNRRVTDPPERSEEAKRRDPEEAPAIKPPAWTQRPHNRRADDPQDTWKPGAEKANEAAKAAAKEKAEEAKSEASSGAGANPLPKRRR